MTQILLVDDDYDNLTLFKIILEHDKFTVNVYSDPLKALEEFRPNFYDAIILDYLMPHLNGMELYEKLKRMDKSIKVIVLTGSNFHLDENRELQNAHDFKIILKPVTPLQLVNEVRSMLRLEECGVIA